MTNRKRTLAQPWLGLTGSLNGCMIKVFNTTGFNRERCQKQVVQPGHTGLPWQNRGQDRGYTVTVRTRKSSSVYHGILACLHRGRTGTVRTGLKLGPLPAICKSFLLKMLKFILSSRPMWVHILKVVIKIYTGKNQQ